MSSSPPPALLSYSSSDRNEPAVDGSDAESLVSEAKAMAESLDSVAETPSILQLPLFMLLGLIAAILIRPWDFIGGLASVKPVTMTILAITGLLFTTGTKIHYLRLPLSRALAVIWGVMLLGILNPYQVAPVIDFGVKYVQFLLLFGLIGTLIKSFGGLAMVTRVLAAVGCILGVMALQAKVSGNLSTDGRLAGLGEGLLSDPNDLASLLVTILPLAFWLTVRGSWSMDRLLGGSALALLLAGIVVTESRGGLIATIAAVGFVFFVSKASFAKKAVVAAVFFAGGIALLPKDVADRYASISSAAQTDESAQSRLAVWTAGARIIRDHPVFGVGVTNFEIVYGSRYIDRIGAGDVWRSAHNSLVEAGAELGVVGLIAWCVFMFGTLPLLWKRRADLRATCEAIEEGEVDSLLAESGVEVDELVQVGDRWGLWIECMMASMIGFLVSAMFLSKAFDISTVIFVGIAVAAAVVMDRWGNSILGVE